MRLPAKEESHARAEANHGNSIGVDNSPSHKQSMARSSLTLGVGFTYDRAPCRLCRLNVQAPDTPTDFQEYKLEIWIVVFPSDCGRLTG
jgi:hypothetical protein